MSDPGPIVPRLEAYPDKRRNPPRERTATERREIVPSFLPALLLVTDWSKLGGREPSEVLQAVIAGGVTMVQMRDRLPVAGGASASSTQAALQTMSALPPQAKDIVAMSADSMTLSAATLGARGLTPGALLFVHGGRSPAAASIADSLDKLDNGPVGLHMPASVNFPGVSVTLNRALFGESLIISRSVHSLEAAVAAEHEGVDMLVLGTVFPSLSHPGGPTIGLDGVREVCDAVTVPVIGIGGITAASAGDVIRAGASGVAVISAIFDAPDPRAAAAELRAAIDAAYGSSPPSFQGRGSGVR